MGKLITPFGEIDIIIDGQPVSYTARAGKKNKKLCSDVLGRFQIVVHYVPDGKEHSIACVFTPRCSYEKTQESGERLECQSFYNDCRFKMSVGVECEAGYVGGKRLSDEYDYDAEYLETGMSYLILPGTKTEQYVFGISWIDDVDRNDLGDANHNRDIQTWFGADPTVSL